MIRPIENETAIVFLPLVESLPAGFPYDSDGPFFALEQAQAIEEQARAVCRRRPVNPYPSHWASIIAGSELIRSLKHRGGKESEEIAALLIWGMETHTKREGGRVVDTVARVQLGVNKDEYVRNLLPAVFTPDDYVYDEILTAQQRAHCAIRMIGLIRRRML